MHDAVRAHCNEVLKGKAVSMDSDASEDTIETQARRMSGLERPYERHVWVPQRLDPERCLLPNLLAAVQLGFSTIWSHIHRYLSTCVYHGRCCYEVRLKLWFFLHSYLLYKLR